MTDNSIQKTINIPLIKDISIQKKKDTKPNRFQHRVSLILLVLILFSCTGRNNNSFIDSHVNETFLEFQNTSFIHRSSRFNTQVIFGYDDRTRESHINGPIIFYFDARGELDSTSYRLLRKKDFDFNLDKLQSLDIQFEKYDAASLSVDILGNVFVGITNQDYPEFIRLSQDKYDSILKPYKAFHYTDKWYHVKI